MKAKQMSNKANIKNVTNMKMKNAEQVKAVKPPIVHNNQINNLYYQNNTTGLGNSLFRGQKFIDFQEPFNDSIKPIRNYVQDASIQSKYNSYIEGEHGEYCQVEIEDDANISEDENQSNLNKEHFSSRLEKTQEKNSFSKISSLYNYMQEYEKRDNTSGSKDKLISNSKYFNNLDKKNKNNPDQNYTKHTDKNLITYSSNNDYTPEKIISYRPSFIEDDYDNIINRNNNDKENSYSNLRIFSDRKPRPDFDKNLYTAEKTQPDENLSRIQFPSNRFSTNANSKNTHFRKEKSYGRSIIDKGENSMITSTYNNNNILNKVEDESKSYIKEFLELYSNSDNKLDDISNFEIRNAIDNNSHIQEQFIDHNREFKNNYNINAGTKPTNRAKSFNRHVANENLKNNFERLSQTGDRDEPVELPAKKKNVAYATSSSSAYLNRRHVETLIKLERLKKEKEIREQSEAKFKPEINKKSREIAYRISNKQTMELKNGRKNLSKSIECIKAPHGSNKPENIFLSDKKLYRADIFNELDNIYMENKENVDSSEYLDDLRSNRHQQRESEGKRRKNVSVESIRYDNVYDEELRGDADKPTYSKKDFLYNKEEFRQNRSNKEVDNDKYNDNANMIINPRDFKNYQYKLPNTINLEINNKIYVPANNRERVLPKLDTPTFKSYVLSPNNDIVNYGTKPNKSIGSEKEKERDFTNINKYNIHSSEDLGDFVKFENTLSSPRMPSNRAPINPHVIESDNLRRFAYQNSESSKSMNISKANNLITDNLYTESNRQNSIDHVEIDLFLSDIPSINLNKKSSNLDNTKTSMIQLFPVFERPVFKLENNMTSKDYINTFDSHSNTIANNKSQNLNNNELKINQNTIQQKDNVKYGYDSYEESVLNEYNMDKNRKQNQSNLNLFDHKSRINYDMNTNKDYTSNHTNTVMNTLQDTLNFSKFTNFVGMSEQYSKKVFAGGYGNAASEDTKALKNSSNVCNKQTTHSPCIDFSNKNMVNSYMNELDQMIKYSPRQYDGKMTAIDKNQSEIKENIKINERNYAQGDVSTNKPEVIVAEIDLVNNSGFDRNVKKDINKKINYFDYDSEMGKTKKNEVVHLSASIDRVNVSTKKSGAVEDEKNLNAIKENKLDNVAEECFINIDDLIKPKYLFKNIFDKPKTNPFVAKQNNISKNQPVDVVLNPSKSSINLEKAISSIVATANNSKNCEIEKNGTDEKKYSYSNNNEANNNIKTIKLKDANSKESSFVKNVLEDEETLMTNTNLSEIYKRKKKNETSKISKNLINRKNKLDAKATQNFQATEDNQSKSKKSSIKLSQSKNKISNIECNTKSIKPIRENQRLLSPNHQSPDQTKEVDLFEAPEKNYQRKPFSITTIDSLLSKTETIIQKDSNIEHDYSYPIGSGDEILIQEEQSVQSVRSAQLDYELKPKSTSSPNYDLTKFSLDIPNAINISKAKTEAPYNLMNDFVSNTIRMHKISQENSQKQINELLNKIRMSQEEHETNLKNDWKNLNLNESSLSNIFRDEQSSFKCENDLKK